MLSDTAKKALEADAEKANEIRQMVLDVWNGAIDEHKGIKEDTTDRKSDSLNVDLDEEIKSYGVETKFNDYIGI